MRLSAGATAMSAERFVQMTGLLLALAGSLALCGLSYDTFRTDSVARATIVRCAL
jgi:hypothetical protein